MKKKNTSSKLENVKELLGDPRKRAIIFFAFYFVFFFVLISMVRSAPPKSEEAPSSTNKPSSTEQEDLNEINYQFIYTIKEDEKTTTYSGKAYHKKENFTEIKDGKVSSYYKLGDHYFKKENGKYESVSNPYIYQAFLDLKALEKLLEKEESIVNGNTTTYQVPVIDLLEFYDKDLEYDGFTIASIPDDTFQVVKENNHITKVECSLSNMIQYDTSMKEEKINSLTITLEFLEFGMVDDFNIEDE